MKTYVNVVTAKEIRDKSDVVCNFYKSAEDVPDPRELGRCLKTKKRFKSNINCCLL